MRQRLALSVIVAVVGGVMSMPAGAAADEGGPPPNGPSYGPSLSADGRWVSFVSEASNLLGGESSADQNGLADVFLVDTQTSTIQLVSSAGGMPADGPSIHADVSADGRYVVFETFATNLVPGGDANGAASDIVRFDAQTGALTLVSRRGITGAQGDGDSFAPTISADGAKVAFGSRATNLVGNDTNGKADIFVRDVVAGVTTRVSTNSSGKQANNASYDGAIAPTGTHVALSSLASNLVNGDTNGVRDVFLKNLTSGKTTRVSVTNGERQAKGSSGLEDISDNGRSVVFSSFAPNLVKNDDNNKGDVFVRDRVAATTVRVSRDGSVEGNDDSFGAAISDDGAFVVFQTRATTFETPDGNGGLSDLYEYRIETKELVRVSVDAGGGWTDGASYEATIAGGGSVIAFASAATDLVAGDDDGVDDVFLHGWIDEGRSQRAVSWWSRALTVA
jgi:Tol biopolymer transport system component